MSALRVEPSTPSDASTAARVFGALPAALITAALIGVGAWGWLTEWHFGLLASSHDQGHHARDSRPLATVRQLNNQKSALAEIVFPSAEAVDNAGIDVAAPWSGKIVESIVANGEVRFDPSRTARLSSRSSGTASRVFKTAGDSVKKGELLALIDAAEVGKAKAEFHQALVQVRLSRRALDNMNAAGSAIADTRRREAEAAARNAEVKLLSTEQALANLGLPVRSMDFRTMELDEVVRRTRLLGLTDEEASRADDVTANLLPVRSPLDGVVLSADAVMGEVVDPARALFIVADTRRVWLTLHITADAIRKVLLGQAVQFRPDGSTRDFAGKTAWTGTAADETTRTIPVRAEAENADGLLRASTLGVGRIIIREDENALLVPSDAVATIQGAPIVFVRNPDYLKPEAQKSFQARVVQTGAREGANTEIRDGLKASDVIASKGVAVLVSEFKRMLGDNAALHREPHP